MQGEAAHVAPACSRRVVVALGSNQGDRDAHLQHAVTCLRESLRDLVVSAFIETRPQGVSAPTAPPFLNAVAMGWSADAPATLLARLRRIEDERGRERPFEGAPRTLDLDLVLVGELVVDTATLTVPHPRFRERDFVLGPLASIAPDLVDPVTTLTVRDLLERLG